MTVALAAPWASGGAHCRVGPWKIAAQRTLRKEAKSAGEAASVRGKLSLKAHFPWRDGPKDQKGKQGYLRAGGENCTV